jgi:trans-aconitate 2-methyltransferase
MVQDMWNPAAYGRFEDQRLRPALDLLARVGPVPDGPVCDLGCGSGFVGPALRARFGTDHSLIGIDRSAKMLAQAAQTGAYDHLQETDVATWAPPQPLALIFSNAVLHWLPDHAALLPRLAGLLQPGGVLAVQVPAQNDAPSHRLWRDLAASRGGSLKDGPGILAPGDYLACLRPFGHVDLWQTEYFQILHPATEGHPVRLFTQSTYGQSVLHGFSAADQADLIEAYDRAIAARYPAGADGSVLYPFGRLFFTLIRSD